MIISSEKIIADIQGLKHKETTDELIAYLEEILQKIENNNFDSNLSHDNVFVANMLNELALAYLHTYKIEEAKISLEKAYKKDMLNKKVLRNLANIYYQSADFIKADEYLSKALKLMPENVELHYHKGICLSSLGKPDEALPFFIETCKQNTEFAGGFFWAGECLLHTENYTEAIKYLEIAHKLETTDQGLLRSYAVCLFNIKHYEKVIEICDELIALIGEDQVFAYRLKGDTYLELGQIQDAVKNHVILASIERELEGYPLSVIETMKAKKNPLLEEYVKYISTLLPEFSEIYLEQIKP